MTTRTKKIFIAIGAVLVILIVLAGIKVWQIQKMIAFQKASTPPPETISSAVVHEENWRDTLTAVGSVSAAQGIVISSEVPGTVTQIAFESGATVKKGDLLVKLDTSNEEAQLRAAEAQADLARVSVERARQLHQNNTVSQSELDQAEASFKQNQGNADAIRAMIDKKIIRAPFDGRVGIRTVNVGETLEARAPIVSLQSLSPVYCDFSLPQQNLSQLKTGLSVRVTSDSYPDQKFEGTLTAINPDLDAITRSVKLQATFTNANQLLRPGMFVRVEVELPEEQKVLAIPATAVLSAPFGDSVFVILTAEQAGITNMPATNLVVRQQLIRAGKSHGDFVSVLEGLKAGETVVSAGLFKLHNGTSVQVNNVDTPKPSMTPNPPNS